MSGTTSTRRKHLGAGNGFAKESIFMFAAIMAMLMASLFGCSSDSATPVSSGSSGGDRSVAALELPDRVSMTQDDSTSGSSYSRTMAAYDDSGTDYANTVKRTWVDDNTEALSMVNEILEVMDQTNYADYVNYGPYIALVKKINESGQSQGGATSTATTTEQYQEMTLNVTRQDEDSPMYVNIWLEEEEGPGDMPMLIRGRFIVTREAGAGYPYGEMEAHFKGNVRGQDGSLGEELFQMALRIGKDDDSGLVTVEYVEDAEEDGGNFIMRQRANVLANEDLTEGNAYTYSYEYVNFGMEEERESTAYVAYDEDYFKIKEQGGSTSIFDKSDLSKRIFRYKLFNKETGAQVTRSSGFPVTLDGGQHGYIGYWGVWAPYGVTISDGDTVTREGTDETYTVVKKRGKLTKHTASSLTLSELVDVEMSYWNNDTQEDIVITWDGTHFKQIGTRNNENGQIAYEAGDNIDFTNKEWEGAWVESLRSWLPLGRLYAEGGSPTNATTLKYHKEQTISPAEAEDLTLYFWQFALDAPITQAVIDGANAAEQAYWGNPPQMKTYFFDASDLVLKEDNASGAEVVFGADLDLSNSFYSWGYHMSPLTTDRIHSQG